MNENQIESKRLKPKSKAWAQILRRWDEEEMKENESPYKDPLLVRIFTKPVFVLALFLGVAIAGISIFALGVALETTQKIADESSNRAKVTQEITDRQNRSLCGFFNTIAYPPEGQGPTTEYGFRQQAQARFTSGPQGLNCPQEWLPQLAPKGM